MTRRVRSAMIAAFAALTLAACATVPDSGPVREGLPNLAQVERGAYLNPQGPIAGADQETIVRGFVRAASSHANGYEIARKFLAPTYAELWDPGLAVFINDGPQQYQSTESGLAVLTLHVSATVDSGGTMTPANADLGTDVQFELTKVNGEWRISSAPNGIILDRSTFSAVWTTRQLYFLSPDQRLVPEIRWFLRNSTMPTQIVYGLLHGPSALMTGATRSAFPNGTTLSTRDVAIVDNTAVIDFSTEMLDADDGDMAAITRQLEMSLQGLAGVTRFQIAVHGTVLAGGDTAISEETPAGEHQSIALMKDGEFGLATAGSLTPMNGLSEQIVELQPEGVTMSPDLSSAAVLNDGGVDLVTKERSIGLDIRGEQIAPSIDALGYIWTYSAAQPSIIRASTPDVHWTELAVPWLADVDVVAMRLSTGGNRLATLVQDETGTKFLVVGVIRDSKGLPIGFTEEVSLQYWDSGAPIDFDWISDNRYVLLSETGLLGNSARVTIGEVSGRFAADSGTVSGGTSVSGGGGRRALLRVLGEQHRMFVPQGSGWQPSMNNVDLIAKVG